jgi:hypothetical protein
MLLLYGAFFFYGKESFCVSIIDLTGKAYADVDYITFKELYLVMWN